MPDVASIEPSRLDIALLVVKPPSFRRGVTLVVLQMVQAAGLTVLQSKPEFLLSREQAELLYCQHRERDSFLWCISQWVSGYCSAYLVGGENVGPRLKALVGPTRPEEARVSAPDSIRARLTREDETFHLSREERRAVDNVVHCSDPADGSDKVLEEIAIFFPDCLAGHVL